MATLQSTQPKRSQETDRHHLLADSDSIAPSESASYYVTDADRTPRATSPALTEIRHGLGRRETIAGPTPQPYKGFPSEAHYLAALHAWAENKKFLEPEKTLVGWYGEKTTEEYANRRSGIKQPRNRLDTIPHKDKGPRPVHQVNADDRRLSNILQSWYDNVRSRALDLSESTVTRCPTVLAQKTVDTCLSVSDPSSQVKRSRALRELRNAGKVVDG
nr:hypothetical protein CFP56_44391 [Quercus suber]